MCRIGNIDEIYEVLAMARQTSSRLAGFHNKNQAEMIDKLGKEYVRSSSWSRWTGYIQLGAGVGGAIIGQLIPALPGNVFGTHTDKIKKVADLFFKDPSAIAQITQKIVAEPHKVDADGRSTILNTKISSQSQMGHGSVSSKAAEDELRQSLTHLAQSLAREFDSNR